MQKPESTATPRSPLRLRGLGLGFMGSGFGVQGPFSETKEAPAKTLNPKPTLPRGRGRQRSPSLASPPLRSLRLRLGFGA